MRARLWIAGALLAAAAGVVFAARVNREMADFEVYRVAGTRVLAGASLYQAGDGHWQFKYLPAFAFAVAPLAALPPAVARGTWFALSLLLLAILLNRSLALLPEQRRSAIFLVGLTIAAMAKFYLREINLGQSNLLLAVLVLGAVGAWRRGRDPLSGCLLAAAAMVKPYAIVFLPYLAVRRRWQALAAFSAVLVAGILLPAARYGWTGNVALLRDWWLVVTTSTAPNLVGQDTISIAGMFAAWFGVGPTATRLTLALSLVVVAACAVAIVRRTPARSPDHLDAALLLFVIPLLSPQGWDYVLLLSTPAVMLLLDRLGDFPTPQRVALLGCLALVGLSIWDVLGREMYGALMMSRALTVCALVEVAFLIRLRWRGAA